MPIGLCSLPFPSLANAVAICRSGNPDVDLIYREPASFLENGAADRIWRYAAWKRAWFRMVWSWRVILSGHIECQRTHW